MGLKDDLIKAKVEGLKAQGANPNDIDTSNGSAIEVECELMKEAIVNFLTNVDFKITQLKAPVTLENFRIPNQNVNIKPQVTYIPYPGGAAAPAIPVQGGTSGATLARLNLEKDSNVTSIDPNVNSGGGLDSTGYVFIGEDPETQDSFDVGDEDGQRLFTNVKLFREDIEEFI
tara:strand:+ start:195 stop:713 length:519 start_codon:yes stop_codon:yes gene_type:complete